jgi:dihydroxyacetone kinase
LSGTAQAAGARGLAGTVFVHKLVGAAAAEGKNLAELTAIGKAAVQSLATMGVSFSAGTSPAVGKPSFELDDNEMELGLGIHGEPGVARLPLQPADSLTETLLNRILQHKQFPATVAVIINNLGATTFMELAIVARHAVKVLEDKGIETARIYAGTFLSSLDMAGISISVLGLNQERLRWLDAPTGAPAWPNSLHLPPGKPWLQRETVTSTDPSHAAGTQTELAAKPVGSGAARVKRAIEAACQALILAEPELTELDRITGDGDLGASMERAGKAVEQAVDSYPLDNIPATLKALAHTLRRELGGSSGPLYAILFLRCGTVLESSPSISPAQWVQALEQGCRAISELGGAKPGDRTMLDALVPFVNKLKQNPEAVLAAVEAAEQGAAATAQMKPKLGRSSYLGDRVLGYPDPGARAVCIWLRAVCESLFPKRNDEV